MKWKDAASVFGKCYEHAYSLILQEVLYDQDR